MRKIECELVSKNMTALAIAGGRREGGEIHSRGEGIATGGGNRSADGAS